MIHDQCASRTQSPALSRFHPLEREREVTDLLHQHNRHWFAYLRTSIALYNTLPTHIISIPIPLNSGQNYFYSSRKNSRRKVVKKFSRIYITSDDPYIKVSRFCGLFQKKEARRDGCSPLPHFWGYASGGGMSPNFSLFLRASHFGRLYLLILLSPYIIYMHRRLWLSFSAGDTLGQSGATP